MPRYKCNVMSPTGRELVEYVEAENENDAVKQLRQRGLYPISIIDRDQTVQEEEAPKGKIPLGKENEEKTPVVSFGKGLLIGLVIIVLVACWLYSVLYGLNVGGNKYRRRYEQDVRETIIEMVREECLKPPTK